jgi:hypothetical protein
MQEAIGKDVEPYFGVLQLKWKIVAYPCCLWDCVVIANVLMACVIVHNILIDNEQRKVLEPTIE